MLRHRTRTRTRTRTLAQGVRERGSVTAETAVLLPVLVVVLLVALWVLVAVGAQLRCVDAARVAAREAARGELDARAAAAARPVAPPGATVTVVRRGEQVEVLVTASVRPFGAVLSVLPATRVAGRAVALVEDREEALP